MTAATVLAAGAAGWVIATLYDLAAGAARAARHRHRARAYALRAPRYDDTPGDTP